jgi:aspartate/methionine/tyrosine aminotransferase
MQFARRISRRFAEMVRERDLVVLSDEIYSRLCYCGGFPVSIASMPGMRIRRLFWTAFRRLIR